MLGRLARSPSQTFLFCAGAFVLGAAAHASAEFPWSSQFGLAAAAVAFLLPLVWRLARTRTVFLIVVFLLAGIVRYDVCIRNVQRQPADFPAAASEFVGTIAGEPKRGIRQTVLETKNISVLEEGEWRPLDGSAQVKIGTLERVHVGDLVRWRCRPDAAAASPDAATSRLFLRGVVWSCHPSGSLQVVSVAGGIGPTAILIKARDGFRGLINRLLPEPESSFLLGLFIGDRDGLPPKLADAFRQSGTSHIVAVSGYNVSRVVDICLLSLAVAAVRRKRAAALAVLMVTAFVVLAGSEASVVRAGLMGGLSLFASLLGRRPHAMNALVGAAAVMVAANPFVLRHDVGFQLSFAAVWGLHALGPALSKRAGFLPEFAGIRQTFGETAAATIFTLPLVLLHFGTLPAIGLFANLFILPLVPWSMASGVVMTAFGSVHPFLGAIPAVVTCWLLRAIEGLASFFALAAPLSFAVRIDVWTASALYVWIALLWFALTKAQPLVLRAPRVATGRVSDAAFGTVEVEIIDYER